MTSFGQNHPGRRRATGQGGRGSSNSASRIQVALGWVALCVVLASVLRNGASAPVVWNLLCLATLLLFAVQVALDVRDGVSRQGRKAVWVVIPYFLVLVWLLFQGRTGLPLELAHPLWSIAPEGAQPTISAQPDAGQQVVMRLSCYAMVFWVLLRSALSAQGGGIAFIQAIAVFSTALALYGMVSQATGYNILLSAEETGGALRASFWNRNTYATFAVFGVLANITAFIKAMGADHLGLDRTALRNALETFFSGGWVYAFGNLVGVAAVAMTLSRGGSMAGIVGVVVFFWAVRRGDGQGKLALIAIPATLVAFALLYMSSGVIDRIDGADADPRMQVYHQAVEGILDRPLLGHGAGAFPEAFRPYTPAEYMFINWKRAHNSYLENAFEFGLPAAAVFYLSLSLVGWRLLRGVLTRRHNQSIPAFALASFVAAAAHSLVDFSLQIPAIAALFAAILGIGWAQSFPTRRRTPPDRDRSRVKSETSDTGRAHRT